MLSLEDFSFKKIIFLFSFGDNLNELKFSNNNLKLYKEGKFEDQVSLELISVIYIIGEFTITSSLIKQLKLHGISLFLLNGSLKCYAEIIPRAEGNYKVRQKQYLLDDKKILYMQKCLVKNKVKNQFKLIKSKINGSKSLRDEILQSVEEADSLRTLLGLEGFLAKHYFNIIFRDYGWVRRAPQTREDIINFMLDIGYTFLFNFVDSLVSLFGFDTYKGFYHQLFFERKSLICDLIEPMRPIIDRQLIKSFNLKQINEKDFKYVNGSYEFKRANFRTTYTKIWFEVILANRKTIYNYIYAFYKFMLCDTQCDMPKFKFTNR